MFPQIILQALFGNPIYTNVSGKQVSQKKVDIASTSQMFLQLYEGLACYITIWQSS
jgi:hypothetical protein